MAVLKCKMCGGELQITPNELIAECDYCGSKQTIPQIDDEKKAALFERANKLRIACDFDGAAAVYSNITAEFPGDAEGYWGHVLCKYGIEYVDDPLTNKKIPTCHRTSFGSVFTDGDYLKTIEKADLLQKPIYQQEAAEIDRIQKSILEIVRSEKPYDVFICYKEKDENGIRTPDSVIANDIYYQLTDEGFKVFYAAISLEDKIGSAYEPHIFAALYSAKVMLVIGTKPEYFNAVWVKNEWSRFLNFAKTDRSRAIFPCFRDMDPYKLPQEFSYLHAQDMGKIGFITDLIRGIRKLIPKEQAAKVQTKAEPAVQKFEAAPAQEAPKVTNSVEPSQIIINNPELSEQMQGAFYEGQLFAGEIPHGKGKCIYKNGDVYEGEFSQGKHWGKGVMVYNNGKKYDGDWKDGNREGHGILYYLNGDRYDGEWKQDLRQGKGVYYNKVDSTTWVGGWKDDKWYDGEGTMYFFKDGKEATGGKYVGTRKEGFFDGEGTYYYPHIEEGTGKWLFDVSWSGTWEKGIRVTGSGVIRFENGDEYWGELKDKTYNGQGEYRFKNGDVYKGSWVNGKREGQGEFFQNGKRTYSGMWKDDRSNGEGTCWDKYGNVYTGELVQSKKSGHGKEVYTSGAVYEGEWLDGQYNGHGVFTYPDGKKWEGTFRNGYKTDGVGTMRDKQHANKDCTYTGQVKNGAFTGIGRLEYEDGEWYEGNFEAGYFKGEGEYHYKDGSVYRGNFSWNKPNGQGELTHPDGKKWKGKFFEGKPHEGEGFLKKHDGWYEGPSTASGPNGIGKYYYNDGSVYEGNLSCGIKHGKGTITYKDGSSWTGFFKYGKKGLGIGKKKK